MVDRLLASGPVTLDEVAHALGTAAASASDVEAVFDALEAAGVEVRSPDPVDLQGDLTRVIAAARALTVELARRPSVPEIAARAGVSPEAVRQALLFAQVLSR